MRIDAPEHDGPAVTREEFGHEIARHLAGRTMAALAMAGQAYRIGIDPEEAFHDLIRLLYPWVQRNIHFPSASSD